MRMRKPKPDELKAHDRVKWRNAGHDGWWQVERSDGSFVRIERGGVSQYVPLGALRVEAG